MKTIVIGGLGLLGREVCSILAAENHEVVCVDLPEVDMCKPQALMAYVRDVRPEAVVNCAAWTEVDACESDPDRAYLANAIGPRNLAVAARKVDAKLIHISTDYVFPGNKDGAYLENDAVGPLSVYGASKEAGERMVREQTPDHFILRTAWLYGDNDRCFPAAILKNAVKFAAEGKHLRVVDDQRGSPTWSRELARQIARVLTTEAFGTYHATAAGDTTWYGFAKQLVQSAGIDVGIDPTTSEEYRRPAHRPANSVLDNMNLRVQGLDVFQDWRQAWGQFWEDTPDARARWAGR